MAEEVSFDALVGPTHNYSGLSPGNLAASQSRGDVARPALAAREGLEKMRRVAALGVRQAVWPPQERPHLPTLRRFGFSGSEAEIVTRAAREAPVLLAQVSSSSGMWAANAATVFPSVDTADRRVHFVVANLAALFHRSLEAEGTRRALAAIFGENVHGPLPVHADFGDEGAANHMRLAPSHGAPGLHVFVFGRSAADARPLAVPARQTREASEAVARLGRLAPEKRIFVRQGAKAILAGAFHNDVVATSNEGVLFHHEAAFSEEETAHLHGACQLHLGDGFLPVRISEAELPLEEAISSYLFNGQILTLPSGKMAFVAPRECEGLPRARAAIERLCAESPVEEVLFVDMAQSMKNGGGPACVRLRAVLAEDEVAAVHPGVWLDSALEQRLGGWIARHYRDRLAPSDLADPALARESQAALDELTRILGLGSIYDFQRAGGQTGVASQG